MVLWDAPGENGRSKDGDTRMGDGGVVGGRDRGGAGVGADSAGAVDHTAVAPKRHVRNM